MIYDLPYENLNYVFFVTNIFDLLENKYEIKKCRSIKKYFSSHSTKILKYFFINTENIDINLFFLPFKLKNDLYIIEEPTFSKFEKKSGKKLLFPICNIYKNNNLQCCHNIFTNGNNLIEHINNCNFFRYKIINQKVPEIEYLYVLQQNEEKFVYLKLFTTISKINHLKKKYKILQIIPVRNYLYACNRQMTHQDLFTFLDFLHKI